MYGQEYFSCWRPRHSPWPSNHVAVSRFFIEEEKCWIAIKCFTLTKKTVVRQSKKHTANSYENTPQTHTSETRKQKRASQKSQQHTTSSATPKCATSTTTAQDHSRQGRQVEASADSKTSTLTNSL